MGGIAADKAFLADKVFLNEEVFVIIPTYKEGRVLAETKTGLFGIESALDSSLRQQTC
jgi:hypothetical protein